jgi:hypothetical protein
VASIIGSSAVPADENAVANHRQLAVRTSYNGDALKTTTTLAMLAACVVLAVVNTSRAEAETLAENTHIAGGGGYDWYTKGATTFGAENFTLDSAATVTAISHVGIRTRGLPHPVSIDWAIYSNDSTNLPGVVLASSSNASFTISSEGEYSVFELTRYRIETDPIQLAPGKYWVAFNNTAPTGPDWYAGIPGWYLANEGTSFDGRSAVSTDSGRTWHVPYPEKSLNFTFRIEGTPLLLVARTTRTTARPAMFRVHLPRATRPCLNASVLTNRRQTRCLRN